MTQALLLSINPYIFSKETSIDPDSWSPDNYTKGHCAVVALWVQDLHGGQLLRGMVNGESHYWNLLPGGVEVDLTAAQFGGPFDRTDVSIVTRDYMNDETFRRYILLRERIENVLLLIEGNWTVYYNKHEEWWVPLGCTVTVVAE